METFVHAPEDIILFRNKALQWAASFETACCFNSNSYTDPYSSFDILIAAGEESSLSSSGEPGLNRLNEFLKNKHWAFGFLSYDLKNEIESLQSDNTDRLKFPDLYFFKPQHLLRIKGNRVTISSEDKDILEQIENTTLSEESVGFSGEIKHRFSKTEYVDTVGQIKDHIKRGDIYEMNFCQEFFAEDVLINPFSAYKSLNQISPTPFSAFFRLGEKYIISASPERFLLKRNQDLISQPIKGTARRSSNPDEDLYLKNSLRANSKEQSENVMIVDLVRNDLTKCSVPGSVKVEELFGIYSFKQVHQMISTVSSKVNPKLSNADILRETFPMGSMTGAPKISAMELIEKFEKTKRGAFSGSVGYFSPEGNFDFNVLIRTLLYNADEKYLSFQAGSAITYASEAEKEYEECLVKGEAIFQILK